MNKMKTELQVGKKYDMGFGQVGILMGFDSEGDPYFEIKDNRYFTPNPENGYVSFTYEGFTDGGVTEIFD